MKKPYKEKELTPYAIGIIAIIFLMLLVDCEINYVTTWSKRIRKIAPVYYKIMDKMDNAVINFWGGSWHN